MPKVGNSLWWKNNKTDFIYVLRKRKLKFSNTSGICRSRRPARSVCPGVPHRHSHTQRDRQHISTLWHRHTTITTATTTTATVRRVPTKANFGNAFVSHFPLSLSLSLSPFLLLSSVIVARCVVLCLCHHLVPAKDAGDDVVETEVRLEAE